MKKSRPTRKAKDELRRRIIRSLRLQGFRVAKGTVLPPSELDKNKIRLLHGTAVAHRIERARDGLFRHEKDLLRRIASPREITPGKIAPRLVEVVRKSDDELLFRYACLHWSIPVSSGYGRRLRFLVVDDSNGMLIGLIGLGDPVYSLAPRDQWIGWTATQRRLRLRHLMDAFVLGAVPPYSYLLCSKLVAMLVASTTVRRAFHRKYGGRRPVIRRTLHDGRLAMITTTSALGRSSVYNRLRIEKRRLFNTVGYTRGSGEFHFSNGLYASLSEFAAKYCEPTAKCQRWGTGFRNRREIVKKSLPALGLSSEWLYHGIEREVFTVPLAQNAREFLRGEHSRLRWFHHSEQALFEHFRDRWMLPRLSRLGPPLQSWSKDAWALWLKETPRHA